MRPLAIAFVGAWWAWALSAAQTLDFYTIDVEGGKSVLIVSPSGESMLFDAGWPKLPDREASVDRIVETVKAAGLKQIDFLVISHFDTDHLGDVPQLVSKIPVRHIYDHGDFQPAPGRVTPTERIQAYYEVRQRIGHTALKPGNKIPIRGVSVEVVAAGGKFIRNPLPGAGAPNPLCATNPQAAAIERDVEDNLSVGLLFTLGRFRMLDLADLEAHYSRELVCPNNLIGTVDVYHVNVHGQFKGMAPELIGAVRPRVAILGNGANKGADPQSWPILRNTPGLEDIWQDHYSVAGTKATNPPEDFIANIEPTDGGRLIKVSVQANGTYTVTNTRNGFSKTYTTSKAGPP
jgi:beta-lactamase superfamily II metal-dependent hydrolase